MSVSKYLTAARRVPRVELLAASAAVLVGVVLLFVKWLAYALTGSAAVFADAAESIVNVAASGFAVFALVYAHRPADAEHPWGHGKIEFLAALLEGSMIGVAALAALWQAGEAMWRGPHVERINLGIALVAVAGVANGLLGAALRRIGRRVGSLTLEADGRHLLADAVTSAVLLAALIGVGATGWPWLDPLAAVALAGYLGSEAVGLVRRAGAGLLDEQDAEDDALLARRLDAHCGGDATNEPRVCSYHKLRHRHVGRDHFVDFHLVVPATWDVARGHTVATQIERELQHALGRGDPDKPGNAFATAHVEPCGAAGCPGCAAGRVESGA